MGNADRNFLKENKSSVTIKIDIGKISFYNEKRGYGFIKSEKNGNIL